MHTTSERLFKLSSLLIVVTLVATLLVFCISNKSAIYDELVLLDLVPKPEKLTELYLNNNTNLPKSAKGNEVISFVFVIHNLETTDYQYIYAVFVQANGTRYIVDSGNILVKNNQYYSKSENFKLMNSPGNQEVIIELTNKKQSVHFWTGK